jgi:hypothetical protein
MVFPNNLMCSFFLWDRFSILQARGSIMGPCRPILAVCRCWTLQWPTLCNYTWRHLKHHRCGRFFQRNCRGAFFSVFVQPGGLPLPSGFGSRSTASGIISHYHIILITSLFINLIIIFSIFIISSITLQFS